MFPINPTPATEQCWQTSGMLGLYVNGAAIYGWGDTFSYNSEGSWCVYATRVPRRFEANRLAWPDALRVAIGSAQLAPPAGPQGLPRRRRSIQRGSVATFSNCSRESPHLNPKNEKHDDVMIPISKEQD